MFQSNSKYYLKSTIPSTLGTGGTFLISNDFELNSSLETGTDVVSLVLKNATQIERMTVTATSGTATIVKRGLTQASAKTEDVSLRKQWNEGTVIVLTALASDLLDVDSSGGVSTIASDVEFTGNVTASKTIRVPSFADESARDAAIPTPTPGMLVEILGTGLQVYEGGIWNTLGFSTPTPDASETVSGKVELATQAEVDAGTDTGGTGAKLVAVPSKIQQGITNRIASQAEAEAGTATKLMTAERVQQKVDYTRASDAEATAGTDTVKFITPKQAKDNYGTTVFASEVIVASSPSTVGSASTTYVKAKEFVCNKTGTYRIAFSIVGTNIGVPVYGRIYKNGVAYGTERKATEAAWTFNEDLAFTTGNLIQIYQKAGGGTCNVYSAYVKASTFPTYAIPTVNI